MTVTVNGAIKQMALADIYVDSDSIIKVRDSFPITPSFGVVWYTSVDMGFPDVRDSVQDLPQASGTLDQTQYTGARAVSIEGVVLNDAFGSTPVDMGWAGDVQWNSASWFCSALSAWADPSRRYRLYVTDESYRSRYMDVRGDSFTSPIDKSSEGYRSFQLNLVNPSGRIYSFAEGDGTTPDGRYDVSVALTNVELTGRAYDLTEPRTYPAGSGGPAANEVYYGGTVPNGFTIKVYTGATALNGLRITVTGPDGVQRSIGLIDTYAVPAHCTVIIDTNARTIQQIDDNSTTLVSIEQYLAAPLQWPQMRPGINYASLNDKFHRSGYNGFTFTSTTAPASDASFHVLYSHADLL